MGTAASGRGDNKLYKNPRFSAKTPFDGQLSGIQYVVQNIFLDGLRLLLL